MPDLADSAPSELLHRLIRAWVAAEELFGTLQERHDVRLVFGGQIDVARHNVRGRIDQTQ